MLLFNIAQNLKKNKFLMKKTKLPKYLFLLLAFYLLLHMLFINFKIKEKLSPNSKGEVNSQIITEESSLLVYSETKEEMDKDIDNEKNYSVIDKIVEYINSNLQEEAALADTSVETSNTSQVQHFETDQEEKSETEEEVEPDPPPPDSCPQTTLNCVPCHKSELYCRYEAGEEYGYLGWACQNNNPSNIRDSSYRSNLITQMGGPAPCGGKGGFLVFLTYTQGRKGVKAYIKAINAGLHFAYTTEEFTCGDCTLTQFFSKYAPNSTNYANLVAQKMGGSITVDTKLNWIVENRLEDFVDAIQCIEGYFIDGGVKLCNL